MNRRDDDDEDNNNDDDNCYVDDGDDADRAVQGFAARITTHTHTHLLAFFLCTAPLRVLVVNVLSHVTYGGSSSTGSPNRFRGVENHNHPNKPLPNKSTTTRTGQPLSSPPIAVRAKNDSTKPACSSPSTTDALSELPAFGLGLGLVLFPLHFDVVRHDRSPHVLWSLAA